jgi:ABC-type branched-subunit amino acid transport system substrate-binding protein/transcriptional regulator with XRE-family HTH domain
MKKAAQATPNKQLVIERQKRQWSQKEVAALLGTTRINVSRWECGITTPSPYFRQKLSQLFGKNNEELGLTPWKPIDGDDLTLEREEGIREKPPRYVAVTENISPGNDLTLEREEDTQEKPQGYVAVAEDTSSQGIDPSPPPGESLLDTMPPITSSRSRFAPLFRKPPTLHVRIFPLISILALSVSLFSLIYVSSTQMIQHGLRNVTATAQAQTFEKEKEKEQYYFQTLGIGISDGNVIFDTYAGRTDVTLKKQAALQLQSGNLSSAVNLMTQAVSTDVLDGEMQIYNENLHVLQSGSPYITIVLGLAIDNNETDLIRARSIMQAAFLAQREVNSKGLLLQGLRLRILIDNSGANNANVATAAQFIANRVNGGNPDHIVAVVGWPFSSQTTNALSIIAGAHLPMVSQTASSVALSGIDPYFFRVNPTDSQQGRALGIEAVKQLRAKNILILSDPTDPYSVSLTNAFYNSVTTSNVQVIDDALASTFGESKTTVEDYQRNVIPTILKDHVDLIFMAGFDADAIRLAHAIGLTLSLHPTWNKSLANIKILSGDAVATSLVLGVGTGPDAALARAFPQEMRRLIFSSFSSPSEWTFAHVPIKQQPVFFSDWLSMYYHVAHRATSELSMDDHAILTYDALQAIVNATTLVHGSLTGETVRKALASFGQGSIPAFQGVSGCISFDHLGDAINKPIALLDIEDINGGNKIVLKQVIGTLECI